MRQEIADSLKLCLKAALENYAEVSELKGSSGVATTDRLSRES